MAGHRREIFQPETAVIAHRIDAPYDLLVVDLVAEQFMATRDAGGMEVADGIDMLLDVADQVAVALENARLYESLELRAHDYQAVRDFSQNIIESNEGNNAAATAEAAKTKLETENATLKTQVAAVRREASMFLANCAVEDGRLPGAERDTMVTSLCNAADFAAEIGRLSARPRTLKTTSATDELAKKKGQGGSAAGQIIELVNARMDSAKEDYPTAFAHVQTDPEHAALFAGLKTPALKLPAKR